MSKLLPVMEIFGPVIQGEGVLAGQQTFFVRFGGCDYRCNWCDSMHAVLPNLVKEGRTMMTPDEILNQLELLVPGRNKKLQGYTVTLSGGNPAMHDLTELVTKLKNMGTSVAVETQGSLFPDWLHKCNTVTFSPKPPSSGNLTVINSDFIRKVQDLPYDDVMVAIKIVVFDTLDFDYAINAYEQLKNCCFMFYMQPGTTQGLTNIGAVRDDICNRTAAMANRLCEMPEYKDIILIPQLHSLMFGYEKGK